jgi:uncharacterized low-complexity protein
MKNIFLSSIMAVSLLLMAVSTVSMAGDKCGTGKCGSSTKAKTMKCGASKDVNKTMKCGAGKCGDAKVKPKAMKCGAGKCGSGK